MQAADHVFGNAERRPEHPALRRRGHGGDWVDVSSRSLRNEVVDVGRGLIAAGIEPGDRVGLMSRTRWEWTVADLAVLAVGAVTVPIYETSSAEQVRWILSDSGARAVLVETVEHRGLVDEGRGELPRLRDVWVLDDGALEKLTCRGASVDAGEVERRRAAVRPSELASVIYTSGTTGRPKGCELTHANFLFEVEQVLAALGDILNPGTSTLLFLPVAHVLGRVVQFGALAAGCTLGHSPDVKNLLDDLAGFRPTFVLAVPRVFEKVYTGAEQAAAAGGRSRIFDRAAAIAVAWSRGRDAGQVPLPVRVQHAVFDVLVYRKLRDALGGRCTAALSGGAPLGPRLGHFFRGVGVPVYEGYGLTESTAAACANRPGAQKIGTVGQPLAGVSARVAEDGELLIAGGVVFRGYWRHREATAEVLQNGWLHTGDIGEIDGEGFVTITGRKKELIVTAGGKNVSPGLLEDRVRAHWLVSQCLAVGDQQPFIAALVTIDPEAWPQWLRQNGLPADTEIGACVDDEALRAEIQSAVDAANHEVSRAEGIRRFAILDGDWTEAGGQVTPSLKLRRSVVLKQNAGQIDALYAR